MLESDTDIQKLLRKLDEKDLTIERLRIEVLRYQWEEMMRADENSSLCEEFPLLAPSEELRMLKEGASWEEAEALLQKALSVSPRGNEKVSEGSEDSA
jgi:hypothetical protein